MNIICWAERGREKETERMRVAAKKMERSTAKSGEREEQRQLRVQEGEKRKQEK